MNATGLFSEEEKKILFGEKDKTYDASAMFAKVRELAGDPNLELNLRHALFMTAFMAEEANLMLDKFMESELYDDPRVQAILHSEAA